ncbi:bifunctional alpha/beta hydrolase/OsmC family protein [Jannaschia aquimarina]|uniref:OsmC-like protein n=1 Tax=Jannaschia aquimarina TaxID=935700 RepID=A0A0D1EIB5_9RHOB|nr:bifunctional alpha/beta hydrolase/OsmC family protein [Jannaschia aquimarina]KIT17334.1 OsmC-like protein [Jannaschia aquimarina]SNT20479.1 putative redox protein [Jannaschia aquimarina]
MPTERFSFPGHDGGDLAARLDLPDGPVLATALFAHCFTCGKDIPAARRIAARLTAAGIAVLRFDFTGLGHSDGEFENTSFSSNVDDLVAAAAELAARGHGPDLMIGHSLGGAAVLVAAARLPSVKAVATIGAPFEPEHVTHHFDGALDRILSEGAGEVVLGGRKLRIGREFVHDVTGRRIEDAVAGLGRALLVMHAPRDEIVGIENATDIFQAAKHPKSFVTLDDADHLVTRAEDAEYAADVIGAWASRYLDLRRPAPPVGAPEGVTRVTEVSPDGFTQDVVASGGRHHLKADEPKAYGGSDLGLTPYQLLAASLGACTSMTLRMYARRKGWPVEGISVDVTHDRMHAQDAPSSGTERIDRFRRVITLTGPLDEEQRDRLLEIADKCPVHRTLETGAVVETELAAPAMEPAE